MSHKKVHTECFYLIDADEYETITQLREKCAQLEKRLAEALKYKDLSASAQESELHAKIGSLKEQLKQHTKVTSETYEPNSKEQVGSGVTIEPESNKLATIDSSAAVLQARSDNEFRKTLVTAFEQFLSSKSSSNYTAVHLDPKTEQTGSGVTDDLTPTLPLIENPSSQLSNDSTETKSNVAARVPETAKSSLEVTSYEDKLLSSVPPTSRPKAQKLLTELKNFQDNLSYNDSGTITLNGHTLPNANFYEIFPLLYQQSKKRPKDSALSLVVNELASLGLGHLIQRSFSAGLLPRGQKYLKDRQSVRQKLNGDWYYLGDNE